MGSKYINRYHGGKLRLGGMVPVTRAVPPFFLCAACRNVFSNVFWVCKK